MDHNNSVIKEVVIYEGKQYVEFKFLTIFLHFSEETEM